MFVIAYECQNGNEEATSLYCIGNVKISLMYAYRVIIQKQKRACFKGDLKNAQGWFSDLSWCGKKKGGSNPYGILSPFL